jgi:hypothetical protein
MIKQSRSVSQDKSPKSEELIGNHQNSVGKIMHNAKDVAEILDAIMDELDETRASLIALAASLAGQDHSEVTHTLRAAQISLAQLYVKMRGKIDGLL